MGADRAAPPFSDTASVYDERSVRPRPLSVEAGTRYRFYASYIDGAGDLQTMPVWQRSRSAAEAMARALLKRHERLLEISERPDCTMELVPPYRTALLPPDAVLPDAVLA